MLESVWWRESYWEVVLKKDKDGWLEWGGNAVGLTTVLDDNGHPFLLFDWSHPIGGHGSWSGFSSERSWWRDSEDDGEDESSGSEDEDKDGGSAEECQVSESEIETAGGKWKASEGEADVSKRRRVVHV